MRADTEPSTWRCWRWRLRGGRVIWSRVSLLLGSEPLWAAVIGISLAGDPLTMLSITGAVLILVGTNWGRIADSRRLAAVSADSYPEHVPVGRRKQSGVG